MFCSLRPNEPMWSRSCTFYGTLTWRVKNRFKIFWHLFTERLLKYFVNHCQYNYGSIVGLLQGILFLENWDPFSLFLDIWPCLLCDTLIKNCFSGSASSCAAIFKACDGIILFKFLRLKVSSFMIFLKIKEFEFHLLRTVGTLGCLSHSSGVRFIARQLSKLLSPTAAK